ncbi:unnamed protein product [Caenorhabditis angaria]|uniref:Uncharacterized protein n=1 Tax=Caenorhabditis angaria TaxID=860376 RepID=A0A9P1J0T1_9PELO|nr:unnamed protein product [Caenorhabditis angaria]
MPKHSNSLIVNFGQQGFINEKTVRKEFKKIGCRVKTVTICTLDKCQGFVTFQDHQESLIDWIFVKTSGLIIVSNKIWSLHRLGTIVPCKMIDSQSSSNSIDNSSTTTLVPSSCSSGFLPLPPPYHILPDTPYFRKAIIIPPKRNIHSEEHVPILQRVINSYLYSMEVNDMQFYQISPLSPELTFFANNSYSFQPDPYSFFDFCSQLTYFC